MRENYPELVEQPSGDLHKLMGINPNQVSRFVSRQEGGEKKTSDRTFKKLGGGHGPPPPTHHPSVLLPTTAKSLQYGHVHMFDLLPMVYRHIQLPTNSFPPTSSYRHSRRPLRHEYPTYITHTQQVWVRLFASVVPGYANKHEYISLHTYYRNRMPCAAPPFNANNPRNYNYYN